MNRCIALMSVLAVVLAAGGAAQADENDVVLYTNDFGTQAQLDAVSWSTNSGSPNLTLEAGAAGGDLDGDGLFNAVKQDTVWGSSSGYVTIHAPIYKLLSNIRFTAYARGWTSNHGSGGNIAISYDNSDWQHVSGSDNSGSWIALESAGGNLDPNYNRVTTTYLRGQVFCGSGSVPPTYRGRICYWQVVADVNDAGADDRVLVYNNDFGTQAQKDEWFVSGYVEYVPGYDLDNDGLGYRLDVTQACWMEATTKLTAPAGKAFKDPIATADGYSSVSHGSNARIRFSRDGYHWDVASTYPAINGWHDMTCDASSDPCYDQIEELWIQLYTFSSNPLYQPKAGPPTVTAKLVAAPTHTCAGDGVYLAADLTGPSGVRDCYVNLLDVAFMSAQWLDCTDPTDAACSP